jgi:hypothetical protein
VSARYQTDGSSTHASGHPGPRSSFLTEKMRPFAGVPRRGMTRLPAQGSTPATSLGAVVVSCRPGTEIEQAWVALADDAEESSSRVCDAVHRLPPLPG